MKRTCCLKYFFLLALALLSPVAFSQVKVEEKPVQPVVAIKTPPCPGDGYFLMPGSWAWHSPSGMYVWIGPVWVVPPEGKSWKPGHWKRLNNGWKWIPGKWKRKSGLLNFTRKKETSGENSP